MNVYDLALLNALATLGYVWKWGIPPNEIAIFRRDNDQTNHWVQGYTIFRQSHVWHCLKRNTWHTRFSNQEGGDATSICMCLHDKHFATGGNIEQDQFKENTSTHTHTEFQTKKVTSPISDANPWGHGISCSTSGKLHNCTEFSLGAQDNSHNIMGLCEKRTVYPSIFPMKLTILGVYPIFRHTRPSHFLAHLSPLNPPFGGGRVPLHHLATWAKKISTTSAASAAARYSNFSYFCIHMGKVETCCCRKDVETFERCESESVLVPSGELT